MQDPDPDRASPDQELTTMLGRMGGGPDGGGVSEQREAAFDFGRHTGTRTATVSPLPPPPMVAPTKLFLAAGSSVVVSGEEELFSPPGAGVLMVSPTSTLLAPAGSPTTSPAAATAVPFSRRRGCGATATTSPSPSSSKSRRRSLSQQQRRPWEARPVGVGLAGALNGDANDALPTAAAATTVLTTGQRIRVLSAREVMEASESEDYTRVIARGANPRTTHIFEDRVVVVVEQDEDEFLRWCHGCSRGLGQGSDIFMYRGEMAFCSHECRHREMLLFDEQEEESS